MTDHPKIRLSGVTKSFGRKKVLDGIDLSITPGQSMVVIGGSGTGKSVMLKCILGLMQHDSGTIEVDGEDTREMSRSERGEMMQRFGMLFQGGALFDSLTIWENVAFGLTRGRGMDRKPAREIAIRTLAEVGLGEDVADLMPAELSGGMQKRVALARAIATDPEIIFFDEPTTGLDPIMAQIINDLIVTTVKGRGATAVSITHDMFGVRTTADRVAMLYGGKIIWTGTTEEMDATDDPYVSQFVNGRSDGPITMALR